MSKSFNEIEIARFRREAKALKKSKNIIYGKATDLIAIREEFANWSLLMRHYNAKAKDISPKSKKFDYDFFQKLFNEFIDTISDNDVATLSLRNGSIWIRADDFFSKNISTYSLMVLDKAYDRSTVEYANNRGALLAIDFDGTADSFVLESGIDDDDDDDDEHPMKIGLYQMIYSVDAGRKNLLDMINHESGFDFDALMDRLDNYQQRGD